MALTLGGHPLSPLTFTFDDEESPVQRVWYQVPRVGDTVVLRLESGNTVAAKVEDIEWNEVDDQIYVRLA